MASVQIHMADRIDLLVDKIKPRRDSIFKPLYFVTQTAGINHYLSLKLAASDGVFAHAKFISPNELMMDVARLLGNTNSSEYSTESLRWRIFKLLVSDAFTQAFPYVAAYYRNEELKRVQLATKLADLFDQYIVYRTDMVVGWQEGQSLFGGDNQQTEQWQKWLWLEIKAQIGEGYLDKASYQRQLLKELQSTRDFSGLQNEFSEIHIFGLTVLTKFHLELLWNLKHVMDVHFYFLNPCVHDFWYDCMSQKELVKKWSWHRFRADIEAYSAGNELLTSWGKVSQELFTQLFALDDEVFSVIDYESAPTPKKTLLAQIQQDIKNNLRPADQTEVEPISDAQLEDGSIKLVSNYSIAREVEVLYDFLVDKIENQYQGHIEPHEIVVMMPQVETYIPFIKAVFDNAPRYLPYSIGDRKVNDSQSVLTVCLTVFQTVSEELTSESVLRLLDLDLIRTQYELHDIGFLRDTVRKANVRTGISGDKNLETHLVAWEQGLMKMLMGVFMRNQSFEFDGETYLPDPEIEGSRMSEVLNFIVLVKDLINRSRRVHQNRNLAQWNAYFIGYVNSFAMFLEDQQEEVQNIKKKVVSLDKINEKLNGIDLSFETYLYILSTYYQNETVNDGYYRGRITFCQALPMRSIPFKIIAFLGLNSGDFPRQDAQYAFDLIQVSNLISGKPKLGDRQTKDNDKYLFLEAILSAQDYFFMSYCGRSIKNNKLKTPSVLVDELMDYIQSRAEVQEVKPYLLTQHPLRRFSNEYLKLDSPKFTYLGGSSAAQFEKALDAQLSVEKPTSLDLSVVLAYFKHPIKHFYARELGVYLKDSEEILLAEQEKFSLDNLDKYQVKTELIKGSIDLHEAKKQGLLPLKNMAEAQVILQKESMRELLEGYALATEGSPEQVITVDLEMAGFQLKGEIGGVFEDNLVRTYVSSLGAEKKNRDGFVAYIEWLVLIAQGNPKNMVFLTTDPKENFNWNHQLYSQQMALAELANLIGFYEAHAHQLLPILPFCSLFALNRNNSVKQKVEGSKEYDLYLQQSLMSGIWDDEQQNADLAQQLLTSYHQLTHPKKK